MWGANFAYYATLCGVFVTSLYSFRLYFLVFHGKERFDTAHGPAHVHHDEGRTLAAHGHDDTAHGDHGHDEHHGGGLPKESPWVVTLPLVLLAVMSVVAGVWFIDPLLFDGYFGNSIVVLSHHPAMAELAHHWHGWVAYALHGFMTVPFLLLVAGFVVAWYC